ncbi:unnamed protein product [Cochlearia groenlandica]
MSKLILILAAQILLLLIVSPFATAREDEDEEFARTMNQEHLTNLHKKEKLTYLHFYWQDSLQGQNPSAIMINKPALNNTSLFGSVFMFDDPLTINAARNSTMIGQAQGFYAGAAQGEIGLMMVMNFAFKTGEYNGSTIAILGRNIVLSKVREMPVVGGSGMFRFARGYVEARTMLFNIKTGDSIVEYKCYVLHH